MPFEVKRSKYKHHDADDANSSTINVSRARAGEDTPHDTGVSYGAEKCSIVKMSDALSLVSWRNENENAA